MTRLAYVMSTSFVILAAIRSMNRCSSKCDGRDRGEPGWAGSNVREDPWGPEWCDLLTR
jgi:hypothetical protein